MVWRVLCLRRYIFVDCLYVLDMLWVGVEHVLACALSALVCFGMWLICVGYVLECFWDICGMCFGYVWGMFVICF